MFFFSSVFFKILLLLFVRGLRVLISGSSSRKLSLDLSLFLSWVADQFWGTKKSLSFLLRSGVLSAPSRSCCAVCLKRADDPDDPFPEVNEYGSSSDDPDSANLRLGSRDMFCIWCSGTREAAIQSVVMEWRLGIYNSDIWYGAGEGFGVILVSDFHLFQPILQLYFTKWISLNSSKYPSTDPRP